MSVTDPKFFELIISNTELKSPPKVLAIGDIHIKTTNVAEINIFIDKLRKYLSENKFDFIVIMGDVLDTHEKLETYCLNKAAEIFEMVRSFSNTFVLVGNHDYISNQQFLSDNHWMNIFKTSTGKNFLKIVDKVVEYRFGSQRDSPDYTFLLCPYVTDGRFKEALIAAKGVDFFKSKIDAIFCHQLFDGAKMGIIAKDVEIWDLPIQIVSGHIHGKQKIPILIDEKEIKEYIYYTGSSLQNSFGESGKKTIASITFSDKVFEKSGHFKVTEIDLGLPKEKIIRCDIKEVKKTLDKLWLKNKELLETKYLKVNIYISGSFEEFKAFKSSSDCKKQIKLGIIFSYRGEKDPVTTEEKSDKKSKISSLKEIVKSKKITEGFFDLLEKNIRKGDDDNLLKEYQNLMIEFQAECVDEEESDG